MKGRKGKKGRKREKGSAMQRRWQGVSSQQRELQGQKLLGGSESSAEAHVPEGE